VSGSSGGVLGSGPTGGVTAPFCELGTGDVDLEGFFAALDGYEGWLVVEQDWVPAPGEAAEEHVQAQVRNRRWLEEHAGL
jgi:sugar phosphate isomerase/epimerase